MRMEEYNNKKDRIAALLLALLVFGLFLLFLFYFVIVTPTPPYPPSVYTEVAIDFEGGGGADGAQGDGNPEMTNPEKATTNVAPSEAEDIVTSATDDPIEPLVKPKKKPKKPKKQPKEVHVAKAEVQAPKASKELQDLSNLFVNALNQSSSGHGGSSDGTGKADKGDGHGKGGTGDGSGEGNGTGNGKGNGYSLKGRKLLKRPEVFDNSQEQGTVVVQIIVDETGKVIDAIPGYRGTSTQSAYLYTLARQAAKTARFSPSPDGKKEQKGTYTFVFRLN